MEISPLQIIIEGYKSAICPSCSICATVTALLNQLLEGN
jgi:hypothetical protein